MIRQVVDPATKSPAVSEYRKPSFQVHVELQEIWKAPGVYRADDATLVVLDRKRKAAAPFHHVPYGPFLRQRKVAPTEEAMWSIPRGGPKVFRNKGGVINADIEGGVGDGSRAGVAAQPHILLAEGLAHGDLEGIKLISARVAESVEGLESCASQSGGLGQPVTACSPAVCSKSMAGGE